MSDTIVHCSFCNKHKDQVGKLIVGDNVAICNECVDLCGNLIKGTKKKTKNLDIPDPQDIKNYLDK